LRPIPLIHRSVLIPAVGILDEIGAPTLRLLRRSRLPTLDAVRSTYVPVQSTWAFANDASDSQGIWDFGFRVAERVTIARASRWGPRVSTALTLRHAIETMKNWIGFDVPNIRVGLEQRGDRYWFWRDHYPDLRHYRGSWVGEQHMLGLMVELVRMAEGPVWLPSRLQVQARAGEWAFKRPEFAGEAVIEFGAARTAIELPPGSLGRRIRKVAHGSTGDVLRDKCGAPPVDLKGSLHEALKSAACDRKLTLGLGAEILCGSERSLQRSLAGEGTSWREVVERVHLETALDLMDEPTHSLADIAAMLGYSQYPHFYRAFRRWTGESPGEYRERLVEARTG